MRSMLVLVSPHLYFQTKYSLARIVLETFRCLRDGIVRFECKFEVMMSSVIELHCDHMNNYGNSMKTS